MDFLMWYYLVMSFWYQKTNIQTYFISVICWSLTYRDYLQKHVPQLKLRDKMLQFVKACTVWLAARVALMAVRSRPPPEDRCVKPWKWPGYSSGPKPYWPPCYSQRCRATCHSPLLSLQCCDRECHLHTACRVTLTLPALVFSWL